MCKGLILWSSTNL